MAASAGLVTLFAGGTLADRAGRRPVLVIGFTGTGTAFVLLALAGRFATLIPGVLLYGLSVSFVDLGANTVGSAYEQAYKVTAMTGLHAWFSGGALAGAIGAPPRCAPGSATAASTWRSPPSWRPVWWPRCSPPSRHRPTGRRGGAGGSSRRPGSGGSPPCCSPSR